MVFGGKTFRIYIYFALKMSHFKRQNITENGCKAITGENRYQVTRKPRKEPGYRSAASLSKMDKPFYCGFSFQNLCHFHERIAEQFNTFE